MSIIINIIIIILCWLPIILNKYLLKIIYLFLEDYFCVIFNIICILLLFLRWTIVLKTLTSLLQMGTCDPPCQHIRFTFHCFLNIVMTDLLYYNIVIKIWYWNLVNILYCNVLIRMTYLLSLSHVSNRLHILCYTWYTIYIHII